MKFSINYTSLYFLIFVILLIKMEETKNMKSNNETYYNFW